MKKQKETKKENQKIDQKALEAQTRTLIQLETCIRDAFKKKKNYVDRETVPIPSYPPTIEAVSEYLDREYW